MILLDPHAKLVIGHRGASGRFPENTLLSYEEGLEAGADALEVDIRVTRDSVPVAIHDPTLARTAGRNEAIADLTAGALAALDLGEREGIPTLASVLECFPSVPLILDIKEKAASQPVIDVLNRCGAHKRVLIGSFDRSPLPPFRQLGIATVAARLETAAFWGASRVGWPWLPVPYAAFSVPIRSSGVTVVDSRFLGLAQRKALPVHVWTIDDPNVATALWSAGACGIITNYPDRMRGLLTR